MSYEELHAQVLRSLHRARALDGMRIVADLYEVEVDEAHRGLCWLIVHPDHVTGNVPTGVVAEINRRYAAAFPQVVPA